MNLTKRQLDNFFKNVQKTSSCWIWKGSSQNGYGRVNLNCKVYRAHRVSLAIFGNKFSVLKNTMGSKGEIVMHKCDNTLCVNPNHLKITTQIENMLDAKIKGRKYYGETKGEGNPNSKLSWKDINLIRDTDMDTEEFRNRFPFVEKSRLFKIKSFKSWIPA